MTFAEVHGYLFVIACSPVTIDIEDWYPLIFNEHDPNYASDDEALWVKKSIFLIYQNTMTQVATGQIKRPVWCQLSERVLDNFSEDSHLAHWARGMLEGHDWLSDVWQTYLPSKLDSEMSVCLMVLSFFSDKNLAQAYCDEYAHALTHSLEDMAGTVVQAFDHALVGYARIGKMMRKEVDKANGDAASAKASLCPCGSGKPFKKCCLH